MESRGGQGGERSACYGEAPILEMQYHEGKMRRRGLVWPGAVCKAQVSGAYVGEGTGSLGWCCLSIDGVKTQRERQKKIERWCVDDSRHLSFLEVANRTSSRELELYQPVTGFAHEADDIRLQEATIDCVLRRVPNCFARDRRTDSQSVQSCQETAALRSSSTVD